MLRNKLCAWALARGDSVGDGLRARNAFEAFLAKLGMSQTGREELAPALRERLHCPACWTNLPPDGTETSFGICPACGHGMTAVALFDPHECVVCGAWIDAAEPPTVHVAPTWNGLPGPVCRAPLLRRPYLAFSVAFSGDHREGTVTGIAGELPEMLLNAVRVVARREERATTESLVLFTGDRTDGG